MFKVLTQLTSNYSKLIVITWLTVLVLFNFISALGFGGNNLWDRVVATQSYVSGSQNAKAEKIIADEDLSNYEVTLFVDQINTIKHREKLAKLLSEQSTHLHSLPGVRPAGVLQPFSLGTDETNPAVKSLMNSLIVKGSQGFIMAVYVDLKQYPDRVEQTRENIENSLNSITKKIQRFAPDAQGIVSDTHLRTDAIVSQAYRDYVIGLVVPGILLFIISWFLFGNLLAAGIPVVGYALGGVVSRIVCYIVSLFVDLQAYSVSIISMIAVALSTGFAYMFIWRYQREENDVQQTAPVKERERKRSRQRRKQVNINQVLVVDRVMNSSGRAIFGLCTLALVLGISTTLIDIDVLKIVGWSIVAITLFSGIGVLTLVPALLFTFSNYLSANNTNKNFSLVGKIRQWSLLDASATQTFEETNIKTDEDADPVTNEAPKAKASSLVFAFITVVFLTVLAIPSLGITMESSVQDYVPAHSDQGKYLNVQKSQISSFSQNADITMVTTASEEEIDKMFSKLVKKHVVVSSYAIRNPLTNGKYRVIDIILDKTKVKESSVQNFITSLREENPDYQLLLTGKIVNNNELSNTFISQLYKPMLILAGFIFIVLFLFSGSLGLSLWGLFTSYLTAAAVLGIITLVFEDGLLQKILMYRSLGSIEPQVVGIILTSSASICAISQAIILRAYRREAISQSTSAGARVRAALVEQVVWGICLVTVFFGFIFAVLLPAKQIAWALILATIVSVIVVTNALLKPIINFFGKNVWAAPHWFARGFVFITGLEHEWAQAKTDDDIMWIKTSS